MKLSAVILAMTNTKDLFEMTLNCINSLLASENDVEIEIIIVESNQSYFESDFHYPKNIKVIVPKSKFNFHKFLNIGIKTATGDYIALCNNDLVFYDKWFTEILKVKKLNPKILSFSPNGKIEDYLIDEKYELGYKVRTHIMGWCLVANRELFSITGFLDETFDFYYADNDYAMTLKCNNIKHAVVYNSKVFHLEKKSTQICEVNSNQEKLFLKKYKIPKYLWRNEYKWVLENEKNTSGFLKFHNKWGNPNFLYRKNKIADFLISYNLGGLVRFFFKLNFNN